MRRAIRLLRRKDDRGYLRSREQPCLAVAVTAGFLDRAGRIFDALIKACRVRGWPLACQPEQPWQTIVTVLGEPIAVGVTEKVPTIRAPDKPAQTRHWLEPRPPDAYEPTGQLTLWLGSGPTRYLRERAWTDGKRQRLETCLNGVMIGLVQIVEARRAARQEAEEQRRRWAEQERQRLLAAERREREKDRREELKRQMAAWSWAREVHAYLGALKDAARDQVEREPDGRLARWIRWAEGYADRVDLLRDVLALPLDPEAYGRTPLDLDAFALGPPTL